MDGVLGLVLRILEFIILFGVLLFTHELGHFVMAKLFKVEVEEFGFGFPPKVVRMFRLWGTDFTLNAIPFGGFVRPKGENDPSIPDGLGAAKPHVRLGVLLGGPLMNILTGVLLFSIIFSQIGVPDRKVVQIMGVDKGSPAETVGLQNGDIVVSINNEPIRSIDELSKIVRANLGVEIALVIKRGETNLTLPITPRTEWPSTQGPLGVAIGNPGKQASWIQALPYGFEMAYEQVKALFLLPGQLIAGTIAPDQARFVGPVGMFTIFSQAREMDEEQQAETPNQPRGLNSLYIMAILAVALGITNLLPIPALDGGRIIFLIPELLFRKRIPAKYENLVHFIGFAALIALMFYITAQDIFNPIVMP